MQLPGSEVVGRQLSQGRKSIDQFKNVFFDRDKVARAVSRAQKRWLSRFGAFVRTRAITSILRHKIRRSFGVHSEVSDRAGVSPPGEPPYTHTGILPKFILFGYEEARKAVVIGPAKTNQRNAEGMGGQTIPEVLEYGGQVQIREHLHTWRDGSQTWERTDLRFRLSGQNYRSAVGKPTRVRTAHYSARPFMRPARDAELPGFFQSIKDSVK